MGLFLNYGYAEPSPLPFPPLRSRCIDIRDAQCAKKNDGRNISYHLILRLCAATVQKGRYRHQKIQLSSKSGQIYRVDWNLSGAHFVHE